MEDARAKFSVRRPIGTTRRRYEGSEGLNPEKKRLRRFSHRQILSDNATGTIDVLVSAVTNKQLGPPEIADHLLSQS